MRKRIILLLLCMFPLVAWGADKPNIIFILSDDVGTGDIKCYYEPSKVTTTNIDKLATQGMRFTQAYAPGSVCSPSRYAFITGSFPCRGPLRENPAGSSPLSIDEDMLTLPKVLEQQGYRTNGDLQGHKGGNYEGGFRVPFIVRWPGKVAAGAESDQVTTLADMLATTAGLLGEKIPDSAGVDSFDLSPVLLGKNAEGPIERSIILQTGKGRLAFRHGDWKLRFTKSSTWHGQDVELPMMYELYNLADDPAEANDLAPKHPERAKEMRKLLLDLIKKGRSR